MTVRLSGLGIVIPLAITIAVGCAKSQEGAKDSASTPTQTTSNKPDGGGTADVMKGLLDGRSFTSSYTENGQLVTDTLSFTGGHFRSYGCDQYGFDHPVYTASAEGDAITFSAHATSAKEGMMHWTGTVKGKTLQGKYLWTKEGQNPTELQFTATEM